MLIYIQYNQKIQAMDQLIYETGKVNHTNTN